MSSGYESLSSFEDLASVSPLVRLDAFGLQKAVVCERYGPPEVLHLKVTKPAPRNNEVLLKILATTVTSADWRVHSLNVPEGFGLLMRLVFDVSKPKQPILGTELAGVVEAAALSFGGTTAVG
jgi:NADPH:quinone reductase-like Zn-dependent oxidoreductase